MPHITIDLYNCKNEKEFIDKLDVIVEKISAFNIEYKNLNTCNNETLYIESYNKEILMELNNYMLEKRREKNIYLTLHFVQEIHLINLFS